jgi:hypothetical protein
MEALQMDDRLSPIPLRPDPTALSRTAMRSLVRAAIAESVRVFEKDRSGGMPSSAEVLKRRGWQDDRLAGILTRAASTPAMPTQAGWAQELAAVSYALLEALTPMSAAAQLLAAGLNLQFGNAGTILVPGLGTGTAAWVAEGNPIRVVQFLTSGPTLVPHKLASISALTLEMIQNQNAEQFVRSALIDSTAPAIDAALFSNVAADASRPAGILLGAVSVTASSSTDKYAAMGDDLSALTAAIANFAGNGSFAFIANPAQAMRAVSYLDLPVPMLMSPALAAGTVIAVATNALASVVEPVEVDASTAATLHMEDATPLELVKSPSTVAAPQRSLFQTASVALKMHLPVTWCVRNAGAVAVVTSVKW